MISAGELIAKVLGFVPTEEQRAAIEGASRSSHSLVIAGAGSGKTQLMAARAIYLVANQHCLPSQLLGLTFTRKAASELNQRISGAFFALRETEFWPENLEFDFEPAKITTYNSFANELFQQAALAIGYDPDATLLTEAGRFQLAVEVLKTANGELAEQLGETELRIETLAGQLLRISQEMVDNAAKPELVIDFFDKAIAQISSLPQASSGKPDLFTYTVEYLDRLRHNRMLTVAAHDFLAAKRAGNQIDFADQVALAAKIDPSRFALDYRFVLLDEYQDTSAMQAQLLASIFRERSVMAVGDANQAIYGWRGASSNGLARFFGSFGGSPQIFTLSTSWRCAPEILAAANSISKALSDAALPSLELKPAQSAKAGEVHISNFESVTDEAAAVAEWFAARVGRGSTQAVLLRSRALTQHYAEALQARGLQVEISGLGGLTKTPEVLDVIAALRVAEQPEAGVYLMRLLAGSRWQIAARDLAALSKFAGLLTRLRPEANSRSPITIIEALDELEGTKVSHEISAAGYERMISAARVFRGIRKRNSLPLAELVRLVAIELQVDIELGSHGRSLANLEAFIDVAAEFDQNALRPTLASFLSWLDFAESHERLEAVNRTNPAAVQLLTVHAAKGLEWDYVALPNLAVDEFPARARDTRGWLGAGRIPAELRADAADLPSWTWQQATTQKELKASFLNYQQALSAHRDFEERRLMYVGVTRARSQLWLSHSFWKPQISKPRAPSPFLLELAAPGQIAENPSAETNPFSTQQLSEPWPKLGQNQNFQNLAQSVLAATPADLSDLRLLLTERELRASRRLEIPIRLSASQLTWLITEPAEFAAALLRPTPRKYSPQAQLGTDFHAALEFGLAEANDLTLALTELSERLPDTEQLVENFLKSEYATAKPLYLEQKIEFMLGGFVVSCKLDAVFDPLRIVDWKTGNSAVTESHLLQLAIYRLALSEWLGVGVERITAALFFVGDAKLVEPDRLAGKAELLERIEQSKKVLLDLR